ncbi:MAG TPA: hypothetical protein VF669_02570 [Tepidisphaeraceae bacterium]|jgi:hypothetical protein
MTHNSITNREHRMAPHLSRRQFMISAAGGGLLMLTGGLTLLQPRQTRAATQTHADAVARISKLASSSPIADYDWRNRGKAPPGYIKGMALSYAKIYHDLSTGDAYATEMAKPMTTDESKDALKHYEEIFQQAGMDNTKAGIDTLRHLFVLMLGLGMRESSGRYCEGRDRSAHNTSAVTAEAGLFQTSFNARSANALMPKLFKVFMAKPTPSYIDIFKEGVRCREKDLENYGTGEGRDFQKLSKACPFFALQFAAIGLRNIRKHWGPINRREAEIKPDADAMYRDVEKLVDAENLGPLL